MHVIVKNFLGELIYSHFLKHCYRGCCLIGIFLSSLKHCSEFYFVLFIILFIYFLCDMFVPVVYLRRKTCIIFQLFSFFLQYFNSIYIIVIEFVL